LFELDHQIKYQIISKYSSKSSDAVIKEKWLLKKLFALPSTKFAFSCSYDGRMTSGYHP
jgi:hypothetical protein